MPSDQREFISTALRARPTFNMSGTDYVKDLMSLISPSGYWDFLALQRVVEKNLPGEAQPWASADLRRLEFMKERLARYLQKCRECEVLPKNPWPEEVEWSPHSDGKTSRSAVDALWYSNSYSGGSSESGDALGTKEVQLGSEISDMSVNIKHNICCLQEEDSISTSTQSKAHRKNSCVEDSSDDFAFYLGEELFY